jgi:ATP-dependent Clp protease ATP-binding subunit ClpB
MSCLQALNKHGVNIFWDSAVEHVIIGAYDVNYGARSIKHEVERSIVSQLAKAHESGEIKENSSVKIVADLSKGEHGTISLKILPEKIFKNVDEIF